MHANIPADIAALVLASFYSAWNDVLTGKHLVSLGRGERHLAASSSDKKTFVDFSPGLALPDEVKGLTERLFEQLCGTVQRHAALIEQALKLNPGSLEAMAGGRKHAVMRVSRYEAPIGEVVGAAHKDIDLLTLIPPPTMPGLELYGPEGWVPAPILPGTILIMSGELLEAAVGTPASEHRIVSPGGSRLSISFFLNARPDLLLTSGRTAAETLRRRLDEISTRNPVASHTS